MWIKNNQEKSGLPNICLLLTCISLSFSTSVHSADVTGGFFEDQPSTESETSRRIGNIFEDSANVDTGRDLGESLIDSIELYAIQKDRNRQQSKLEDQQSEIEKACWCIINLCILRSEFYGNGIHGVGYYLDKALTIERYSDEHKELMEKQSARRWNLGPLCERMKAGEDVVDFDSQLAAINNEYNAALKYAKEQSHLRSLMQKAQNEENSAEIRRILDQRKKQNQDVVERNKKKVQEIKEKQLKSCKKSWSEGHVYCSCMTLPSAPQWVKDAKNCGL